MGNFIPNLGQRESSMTPLRQISRNRKPSLETSSVHACVSPSVQVYTRASYLHLRQKFPSPNQIILASPPIFSIFSIFSIFVPRQKTLSISISILITNSTITLTITLFLGQTSFLPRMHEQQNPVISCEKKPVLDVSDAIITYRSTE